MQEIVSKYIELELFVKKYFDISERKNWYP